MAKKEINGFTSFLLCILFLIVGFASGGVGFYLYKTNAEISKIKVFSSGDITFHFLELGNEHTGDCTFIQANGVDILIDAGSDTDSISTITSYINNYILDNKIEYVIVTHAHKDHYAGFATDSNKNSIFDL